MSPELGQRDTPRMTTEPHNDDDAPEVAADVIQDLDTHDDDIDVIRGGCKGTRLICSPTETV